MNFSTDQVRQFYTVLSKVDAFDATTPVGALKVASSEADVWFEYMSPNAGYTGGAGVVRSDLIHKKCIKYVTASPAKSRPLKRLVVSLNPDVNGGNPVVGQEYILRYTFFGLGIGGPENQYIKEAGSYRVKPGDTAATIMQALKTLSDLNFSREPIPYVTTTVAGNTLVIEEVLQPWIRGKRQASQVNFTLNAVTILFNGTEYPWGTIADTTTTNTNVLGNGKVTADMEYFYLGERGDQYRYMGFPNNFETVYLVDPNKQYNYVDISHYYAGDTEDIQKSKKVITLAIPTDGTYTVATLVADLEAAGLTVVDKTTTV